MSAIISTDSFFNELEKIASGAEKAFHAMDLAGLGALAAPTVAKMTGHPMSEKWKDRAELGGLAALAIPVARHLKHASVDFRKLASFLKAGQAGGALKAMMANPANKAHAMQSAFSSMKPAAGVPTVVGKALPGAAGMPSKPLKQNFGMGRDFGV